MAKNAADESNLGKLHSQLTKVFSKILEKHLIKLDALTVINKDELESEVLQELLENDWEPSPAMLSAVSKFLKDNDIMYNTEDIQELTGLEKRLEDKRKNRENVISLSNLQVADG